MIKRVLLIIVLGIVALVGVLSLRALGMDSLQNSAADGPPTLLEIDTEAALERFAGAIRIPTISFERTEDTDTAAFLALHEHFRAAYPRVHETLKLDVVAGLSLLYTWEGSEPELEPVVLMGHQDVVPVTPGTEDAWTHPAYGGVIDDGYVWGRGSMDDKVSVVAILEAVEALLDEGFQPRRTVYLAFGPDEEVGGVRGAAGMARLLESRGAEPYAFVVDEGGAVTKGMIQGIDEAVALVGIAEKGYVNLELTVAGTGGHSSTPPPSTAIGILAEAISELEEDPFPPRFEGAARSMFEYLGPEMDFAGRMIFGNLWLFEPLVTRMSLADPSTASMVRTTTAVTIVEGGVKANVLPISARAVVNHRIMPGETQESVLARVVSVIDDDRVQVRILGDEGVDPSPVSDPSGEAFQMLASTIRQVLEDGDVVVAPYLVMGGTDAKHYAGRSPNVFRFLPATMEGNALQRVHGTDERMSIDGFMASIQFFQQLIRNSDGL
jgi:carboxypeptidase PM20D1